MSDSNSTVRQCRWGHDDDIRCPDCADRPVRGRKPLPPEERRTGRLPFRVLPAVEEKAKLLGRERIEELILRAKLPG